MRQYNFQVLDNIISQEEADYYEMLTLGRCNGRYMLPVINYKPKWEPTAKGESESIPLSFWHPLKDDLVTGSEHLEIFLSPLIEFCKIKSFPLRELLNARIFITQPLDDKERKHFSPHTDMPHLERWLSAIYYVNDANGPTYFFRDDGTILTKVEPKKGRLVAFDGTIKHGGGIPTNGYRCIINYNFIA